MTAYREFADRVAALVLAVGIKSEEISDERVRVEENGSLVVYVTLAQENGEVSMTIPPNHWAWALRQ